MTPEERIKYAIEEAKKSAKKFFEDKPEYIKKELEDETVMGNIKNIAQPDDKSE